MVVEMRLYRTVTIITLGMLVLFGRVKPAHAQHGDYLLGTGAAPLAAQQPPEGILYSNLWSYYWASGGFERSGLVKCGPLGRICLSADFNANGSLDLFVDQNIFWLVTPFTIPFLDATYGVMLDVPFAIGNASGAAALEPTLSFTGRRDAETLLQSQSMAGGVTKGSIGDIYFEPIDLGWHFKQLDALVTGAVVMPSGPYNSDARFNIGFGHWTGLFGLGGVAYADAARTWSLSILAHYEMYSSQMGRSYVLGDELPFEWGLGKTFNLPSQIFKQVTIGPAGYAQWQTTDNQIQVTPATAAGRTLIDRIKESQLRIYSAGPSVQLLTKYGLFALRYFDEFGANATPSGQQLMFSLTVAGNPWK